MEGCDLVIAQKQAVQIPAVRKCPAWYTLQSITCQMPERIGTKAAQIGVNTGPCRELATLENESVVSMALFLSLKQSGRHF